MTANSAPASTLRRKRSSSRSWSSAVGSRPTPITARGGRVDRLAAQVQTAIEPTLHGPSCRSNRCRTRRSPGGSCPTWADRRSRTGCCESRTPAQASRSDCIPIRFRSRQQKCKIGSIRASRQICSQVISGEIRELALGPSGMFHRVGRPARGASCSCRSLPSGRSHAAARVRPS